NQTGKTGLAATPGVNHSGGPLERFRADPAGQPLTTNQGVRIADNQNSLKADEVSRPGACRQARAAPRHAAGGLRARHLLGFRVAHARIHAYVDVADVHWNPKLGTHSLVWDEAVKISGADPDYHRRDLWEAIEAGQYPEWELCVQLFTEEDAERFSFDILDATKIIPEELVPLRPVGRMVLNRNLDNFF